MRCIQRTCLGVANIKAIIFILAIPNIYTATVKDIFNLNTDGLVRLPRESKYYLNRYGSAATNEAPLSRSLKPEDSPEAREDSQSAAVGKRCVRCDSGYTDSRSPYDTRSRYDDRRNRYDDRYDRFDKYDRYDRYEDRDRDRYNDRSRYDDRYDRDRYYDRRYDDYDRYDRWSDRSRYDRNRNDQYDSRERDRYYDRNYDRGVGYDNRGYDYRDRYERDGYRPWDETYRGSSGFDNSGRGYYFASGRPDYGSSGYWGGGYASSWNYGKDDREKGYVGGYRPRDPYDGYRGTSYLYGRPSSTTTNRPTNPDNDGSITQSPQPGENASG